jgi:hypothetical protein
MESYLTRIFCYEQLLWPNNSNILVHNPEIDSQRTYTCTKLLPSNFMIIIRFLKLKSSDHISLGVTDKLLNHSEPKYLGGDFGAGNWGISGQDTVGEGGRFENAKCSYKQNDTFTIFGVNGKIQFAVNGVKNEEYKYNIGTDKLYLAVTLTYKEDSLEICEETL